MRAFVALVTGTSYNSPTLPKLWYVATAVKIENMLSNLKNIKTCWMKISYFYELKNVCEWSLAKTYFLNVQTIWNKNNYTQNLHVSKFESHKRYLGNTNIFFNVQIFISYWLAMIYTNYIYYILQTIHNLIAAKTTSL